MYDTFPVILSNWPFTLPYTEPNTTHMLSTSPCPIVLMTLLPATAPGPSDMGIFKRVAGRTSLRVVTHSSTNSSTHKSSATSCEAEQIIYLCLLRHSLVAATQLTKANRQNYETPPALEDPDDSRTNCCQRLKNRYLQRGGRSVDTLWYALLGPSLARPICGPKAHPFPLVIYQIPMNLERHTIQPLCRQHAPGQSSQVTQPYLRPGPWPPRRNCRVREARHNAACFLQRLIFQRRPGAVHLLFGRN